MKEFTFGSLFAGIGGLDLGLERSGMVCKWQVEIDDFCLKVLEKHWPDVERYEDVKECGKRNLSPVDLVCGGFPCQDVSVAGKRKGLAGERSGLWFEMFRIVREIEPRWVLVENVPGLLSIDSGGGFGTVLRDLAEGGYDAEWDCIPAAAFGAPHLRYRVFVVGISNSLSNKVADPQGRGFTRGPKLERDPKEIDRRRRRNAFELGQMGFEGEIVFPDPASLDDGRENPGGRPQEQLGIVPGRIFGDAPRGTWAIEPDVGRVADGVPDRVDRIKSLGNAVVPQVAEWIGRRIMEADDELQKRNR